MEKLNSLYITIIVVVFIITIFEILTSGGKLSGFLKSVFSIFMFLALFLPLLNILKLPYDYNQIINTKTIEIDKSFLQSVQNNNLQNNAKKLQNMLKNEYNCDFIIKFNTKFENDNLKLDKVFVEVFVLNDEALNINLISEIKTKVANGFEIEESRVMVSGK